MVGSVQCRYLAPLLYDSEFVVRTRIKELRRRTVTFAYELLDPQGEAVYAQGETAHVVTDREGKPKSLPEYYEKLLMESR